MTTDPIASRLVEIADELTTTNRRVVQRDEAGQITGIVDVPTNVPRLLQDGIAVMDAAWSRQPDTVDALGRLEQLRAMRAFAQVAAEHVPDQAAPMRERVRQITNAIRLHFDDPA